MGWLHIEDGLGIDVVWLLSTWFRFLMMGFEHEIVGKKDYTGCPKPEH